MYFTTLCVIHYCLELATTTTLEGLVLLGISPAYNNQKYYNTFINTGANTKSFWIQYQYQFQYLRIWKGIPISISIPKKSELNNNTNINTQIFQIQYQAQYNTEVSRYFAISRQYQKNSSRYRAFMYWATTIRANNISAIWFLS